MSTQNLMPLELNDVSLIPHQHHVPSSTENAVVIKPHILEFPNTKINLTTGILFFVNKQNFEVILALFIGMKIYLFIFILFSTNFCHMV